MWLTDRQDIQGSQGALTVVALIKETCLVAVIGYRLRIIRHSQQI